MSSPLLGRRQLIVGGGTFLAGMAAVAVWNSADPPRPIILHDAAGSASSSSAAPTTSAASTSTTSSTPASSAPPSTTTTTVAPTTSAAPPSSSAPTAGAPATYVSHGPLDGSAVALTFHLGGTPRLVATLLDVLKADELRCTLFAIGNWLTANPDLGHRAVDEGHELANHTKSHKSMLELSAAQVYDEIVGGGEALVPFIGSIGKWFRPSGTDVPNQTILDQAGLAGYPFSIGYDLDSLDDTNPGARAVVRKVGNELHPGAIVSLHFGHQSTIAAMPGIVDLLHTASLSSVTVSELLGH